MSKALGKDINEFYNNHFPEGHFIEGQIIDYWKVQYENGDLALNPTQKYELKYFGYIVPDYDDGSKGVSFESAFKKWQKNQTHVSIVLEVPREDIELISETLKMNFPKVKVVK